MTLKERLTEVLSCETSVLDPDDAEALAITILQEIPEIYDAFTACRSITVNWTRNLSEAARLCEEAQAAFES